MSHHYPPSHFHNVGNTIAGIFAALQDPDLAFWANGQPVPVVFSGLVTTPCGDVAAKLTNPVSGVVAYYGVDQVTGRLCPLTGEV